MARSKSLSQSLNKTKKITKKKKKDDFNYKEYIDIELKRMNAEKMEGKCRKRLIQKIRNRMSAQRSRQRNKNILESLKIENEMLKSKNEALIGSLKNYRQENEILRLQLDGTWQYKKSYSSTDNDEMKSFDESDSYSREEGRSGGFGIKNIFLLSMMIIALLIVPGVEGKKLKMRGVIIDRSDKEIKSTNRVTKLEENYFKYKTSQRRADQTNQNRIGIKTTAKIDAKNELFFAIKERRENGLIKQINQFHLKESKKHDILFKKTRLASMINKEPLFFIPLVISSRSNRLLTN